MKPIEYIAYRYLLQIILTSGPNVVLTYPIIRGITAPPDTAIISKPDISLARSGILANAIEKMIGNIFPIPNPGKKYGNKCN